MGPLGGDSGDSRQRKSQLQREVTSGQRHCDTSGGRPGSRGQGSMKIRKQSSINTPDTHLSTDVNVNRGRQPVRRASRGGRPPPKGQLQGETSAEELGRERPPGWE